MPTFQFEAMDSTGAEIKDVIETRVVEEEPKPRQLEAFPMQGATDEDEPIIYKEQDEPRAGTSSTKTLLKIKRDLEAVLGLVREGGSS